MKIAWFPRLTFTFIAQFDLLILGAVAHSDGARLGPWIWPVMWISSAVTCGLLANAWKPENGKL